VGKILLYILYYIIYDLRVSNFHHSHRIPEMIKKKTLQPHNDTIHDQTSNFESVWYLKVFYSVGISYNYMYKRDNNYSFTNWNRHCRNVFLCLLIIVYNYLYTIFWSDNFLQHTFCTSANSEAEYVFLRKYCCITIDFRLCSVDY